MKPNTYSLLNSPWLITDASASALMPALLSMVKGQVIAASEPEALAVFTEYDDEEQSYNTVEDIKSDAKYIPVLSIKNPIFKYDQSCGPRGTQSMIRLMKEWEGNDNVMGVVLDIDSGGGQAYGTPEFANFIYNYSKPVVSYTNGMICSAAYWIAAAAKGGIIANANADFIGSVGTMIRYVNLEGILKAEGAVIEDIYASLSQRKNEENRAKEKDNSNDLIISNILDPYNERFHNSIKTFRPGMDNDIFSGAVYFPPDALKLKLIDTIGPLNEAFDKIVAMSKKQKSSNQNPNNMSKTRAKVQAVLGLSAPLAATAENGSYLNEEQLDTLENSLAAAETNAASLQTEAETANTARTTAEQALADANTAHTAATSAIEASVDAILTGAALPIAGTLTEKLSAVAAHQEVLNKKDGARGTTVIVEGDAGKAGPTNIVGGVDITAAMNN